MSRFGFLQSLGSRTSSSLISLTFLCSMLCMWTSVECWSYHYSNSTMNWQMARDWCRKYYTDMVAIQNREEINHLNTWLPQKRHYYWIGIRKVNGTWTWVGTNKALTEEATNWARNEPNNGVRGKNSNQKRNEDCVEMYVKREEQSGKWNDERCTKLKTALCYSAACKSDSCLHGECVETINSHRCACFDGFYGEKCEEVVKCNQEELTTPSKGSFACTHKYGDFSYDSSCQYSCEEGYQLSSPGPLKCTAAGTWSEQPPTCELVQCQMLSSPDKGSIICTDPVGPSSYQSTCVFSCDEGYVLTGSSSSTLQCEASGEWNSTRPYCVAVQCPALHELDNGRVNCGDDAETRFSYKNSCSFSCETGFELQGAETIQCTKDGQWSEAVPTCKERSCPIPELPAKTQISCSSLSSSNSTSHPLGVVCTFSCDEGHELQGALSMECVHPGRWTSAPPKCLAVRCPVLEDPENGRVNCSSSESVYSSQCSFTCNKDFTLDGHELLTCDRHGNWTGEKPSCYEPPSKVTAIASSVATAGTLLSGLSVGMWVLKRLRKKAAKFELNSNSDIDVPTPVYKNSIDSLI